MGRGDMSLITLNLPPSASTSLRGVLERIAIALERIAGPPLLSNPVTQSTIADYAIVTPEDADRIQQAERDFGAAHLVVPGSEAYVRAVQEFEGMVADAYGEEEVKK